MKIFFAVFILLFIAGCTPLNKRYNQSTYNQDINDIKEYGASKSDVALLRFYIEDKNFRKTGIPASATYQDLLSRAKTTLMNWQLNEIKIKEKLALKKAQANAKIDSMKNIIAVSLISKDNNVNDVTETLNIKFNLHNNTSKDIRAFRGTIIFKNVFGDILKRYLLECNILIAAHQSISYTAQVKYDPFIENDVKLLDINIEDLKFDFEPKLILFDNGNKMQL